MTSGDKPGNPVIELPGSQESETASLPDARLQELRDSGSDDQQDRTRAKDQEGSVQHFSIDSESWDGNAVGVQSSARRMRSSMVRLPCAVSAICTRTGGRRLC